MNYQNINSLAIISKAAQLLDTSTLDVSRIASERNLLVGAAKT